MKNVLILSALMLAAQSLPAAETNFVQNLPLGKQFAIVIKNAARLKPAYSGPLPGVWLIPEKIDAVNGIKDWRDHIQQAVTKIVEADQWSDLGYTECRETSNISGVIICFSYLQADLGHIFQRAGIYAEGGYSVGRGAFVRQGHPDVPKMDLLVGGQDLTSLDLKAFYDGMTAVFLPRSGSAKASAFLLATGRVLNQWERAFYSNVFTPFSQKHDKFVVLAVACQATDPYQIDLGHEIMHAQYFMDSKYRGAVELYWSQMREDEKTRIRKVLGDSGYDPSVELLMRNEFQAYILEPDDGGLLKDFVSTHRAALTKAIEAAGSTPIQVH